MHGHGNLDEPLQKTSLRIAKLVPLVFPMLVRFKELLIAIAGKSRREPSAGPIERHI